MSLQRLKIALCGEELHLGMVHFSPGTQHKLIWGPVQEREQVSEQ